MIDNINLIYSSFININIKQYIQVYIHFNSRVKNDQFPGTNLYYHKQNQNSKISNLHLKTLKIILNKI